MRPIRDDSGDRNGWWIGERFVPEDGSDLTKLNAEIAALREFVRWHVMHHPQSWPGNAEIMPSVRRALEETP